MPRRILLITAGETPQLVTETVHSLLTRPEPWVPDAILIATTASGATLFRDGGGPRNLPQLFGQAGKLRELYADLGYSANAVEPELILACAASGVVYPDIRSPDQVNAFASALLARVRVITADDSTELHLSIAGGRKTMSFIAGQVMSLCGRPCDTLSHCLVEPQELEGGSFWWPKSERSGSTVQGRVDLHSVPFIRLAAHLDPDDFLPPDNDFARAVDEANTALAANSVLADFTDRSILAGGRRLAFDQARDFAAYATLLFARAQGAQLTRIPGGKTSSATAPRQPAIAWNGDVHEFNLAFSLIAQLLRLSSLYEGFPESVEFSRIRLYHTVEAQANAFDYQYFNIPISNAKAAIHKYYSSRLGQHLIFRQGKKLPKSAMEPNQIGFRLPYGLDLAELLDELRDRRR